MEDIAVMLHLEKLFQLLVIIQLQARLPQVTLMLYQFVAIVQIAFKHFDSILSMYFYEKHDQISSSFMTKIMIAYLLMPNRIVTRSSF